MLNILNLSSALILRLHEHFDIQQLTIITDVGKKS
jgi:hypothetical protein